MTTANNNKKKKENKPRVCYFCLWNTPTTEIHKSAQTLPACRHCYNIMQPLVDSKGIWGWNIAALRPMDPEMVKLQHKQLLKCEHCNFRTIDRHSLNEHLRLTHRPNHSSFPPNIQTDASKQDWLKKVGRW